MQKIIDSAHGFASKFLGQGMVADYIPELSKADANHLAVAITDLNGVTYSAGHSKVSFTIQSVSKLLTLAIALEEKGRETVFNHVGMEATGDAFNSILRLETNTDGLPSNPMINAGAISMCTLIEGKDTTERLNKVVSMASHMLGVDNVEIDDNVYKSETRTGDRNRSLAYLMRNNGVFGGNVDEHLSVYFATCSMLINAENLSFLGAVLAGDGMCPKTKKQLLAKENARIVRAMMAVAGMYDGSGSFALNLGFPAKSGVGGGICGAVPHKMGIGVFCPALDEKGNSLCGIKAMEYLSQNLDIFVY